MFLCIQIFFWMRCVGDIVVVTKLLFHFSTLGKLFCKFTRLFSTHPPRSLKVGIPRKNTGIPDGAHTVALPLANLD